MITIFQITISSLGKAVASSVITIISDNLSPQPKQSSVSPVSDEDDKSGFEDCTIDLVEEQACKGKVVVSTVLDADDEILDFSDINEPIHFETEPENPDLDSKFFQPCGMDKKLKKGKIIK